MTTEIRVRNIKETCKSSRFKRLSNQIFQAEIFIKEFEKKSISIAGEGHKQVYWAEEYTRANRS